MLCHTLCATYSGATDFTAPGLGLPVCKTGMMTPLTSAGVCADEDVWTAWHSRCSLTGRHRGGVMTRVAGCVCRTVNELRRVGRESGVA